MTRGDVVRLPARRRARGHEQRGARFGVLLQADELSALSTVLVAPTSTSAVAATFRPVVEIDGTTTLVMVDQLRAVSRDHVGEPEGHLDWDELAQIERALRVMLSL